VSESVIATNSKTPVLKSEQFLSGARKQELNKIRIRSKDKSDFKSRYLIQIQIYYYLA
jgi:predicted xylose isomerase-like sugar epimerase